MEEETSMRVLIWGTGVIAKYYIESKCFIGHQIVGFVDSYKSKELFMGYIVYKPQDIPSLDYDYLIICVLKHNSAILKTCIAEKINLEKILFTDQETGFKDIENKYLQQLLSKEKIHNILPVLCKGMEERQTRYNYYNNVLKQEFKDNTLIHNLGKNHVIAWIPIELIFSEKQEDSCSNMHSEEWMDIPIISIEPYKNLFLFFMNGLNYPDSYCEWYQKQYTSKGISSGYTNEQLIESSFIGFKRMQYELNQGMDFFIKFPAIANWNDRGYFNLVAGHHRTAFLYYSGMARIPVQITQNDYHLWCNKDIADIVHNMLSKQEGTKSYQMILNPYFLNAYSYRQDETKSVLYHILEYLGSNSFIGKKVIDIGTRSGYIGQAFYRMGAEVSLLETDTVHNELMQRINDLLYTKCKVVTQKFEEYETEERYDIGILLTVFYYYSSNETISERFIQHINEYIHQMLIWESEDCPDKEKNYILRNTKFHNYRHLCYAYVTGKLREFGIFMSDDSEYL